MKENQNEDERTGEVAESNKGIVVPRHGSKEIATGTVEKIKKSAGI